MKRKLLKLFRTILIHFPPFVEFKYWIIRSLRNGFKIPSEKDFLALRYFPENDQDLFLNVGAHRGQSTDGILMVRKKVRLELFEPNPLLFNKLKHMYKGDNRININNFGLGSKKTESILFIPFYKKWIFDGFASLSETNAKEWLKYMVNLNNENHITMKTTVCEIKILDDFDLAPFFYQT